MRSAPDTLARAVLAAGSLADAQAEARKALAADARRQLLPLKMAAHELGVSTKTTRRRAKAGAGVLTTKGWMIDIGAAAEMGRRAR